MGEWLSFNELLRLYGGDRKLVDPIWNACIADPRRHQWSPYEFAVLQIWYDLPDPRKLSDVKSMLQLIETDPEVQGEVDLKFWGQLKAWPVRDDDKYFNKKTGLPIWEESKVFLSCLLHDCPSPDRSTSTDTHVNLAGAKDSFVWCVKARRVGILDQPAFQPQGQQLSSGLCGEFILVVMWPSLCMGWLRGCYIAFAEESPELHAAQRSLRSEWWWNAWGIPSKWRFQELYFSGNLPRFFFEFVEGTFNVHANSTDEGAYFAVGLNTHIFAPAFEGQDFYDRYDRCQQQPVCIPVADRQWLHLSLCYAQEVGQKAMLGISQKLKARLSSVMQFLLKMCDAEVSSLKELANELQHILVPSWRNFEMRGSGVGGSDHCQAFKDFDPDEHPELFHYLLQTERIRHFKLERLDGEEVFDFYRRLCKREKRRHRQVNDFCKEGYQYFMNHRLQNSSMRTCRLSSCVPNALPYEADWKLQCVLFALRLCLVYECPELHHDSLGHRDTVADDYMDTDDEPPENVEERSAPRKKRKLRILDKTSFHMTLRPCAFLYSAF